MSYPIAWQDVDNLLPEDRYDRQEEAPKDWQEEYARRGRFSSNPPKMPNVKMQKSNWAKNVMDWIIWGKYEKQ